MPDLQFDETKDFDQNLESFLIHMEGIDSELGAILRANIDQLKGAFDESTRRAARTRFNENVLVALDALTGRDGASNE